MNGAVRTGPGAKNGLDGKNGKTALDETGQQRSRGHLLDRPLTYKLLFFVALVAGWEAFARNAAGLLIPGSVEVFRAGLTLVTEARLWQALAVSNVALVGGFALAVVVGVPLGLGMGRFRTLERLADVYVSTLLVTPLAGIMPLIIMALGIGLLSRVVIVCIFAIVMIVVNSRAGVRGIDQSVIEMARSFGATEYQVWKRVLVPGALPAIMTGIRIGLGRAVTGMVIVELLLVAAGVGGLILRFRGILRPDLLYATVLVIVFEALILIRLAERLEKRSLPWAAPDTDRRVARTEGGPL